MEINKEPFSTFWNLQFSIVLSFSPLVVQNYHTHKTDNGKGPNMTGTINELKRLETRHSKHWALKGKIIGAMQPIKKHRTKNETQVTTMQGGVVCYTKF